MGVMAFGANALQSIGQQQQAESAYEYQNASQLAAYNQRATNYYYQERERDIAWNNKLALRAWKTKQYHEQVEENFGAMQAAWFNNNKLANEYIEKFAGQAFRSEIAFMEAQSASYNEQAGKRANLRQGVNAIRYGMERVNMADQLALNLQKIEDDNAMAAAKAKNDNKNAWYGVSQPMVAPSRGPAPTAPVFGDAPSRMGMYGGLLAGAVGGFMQYDKLKAGGAFGQRAKPAGT